MFGGRLSFSIGSLGVDWGSNSIRMLQLRQQDSQLHVVGAAEVPLPNDEGSLTEEESAALTERIRAAFAAGGFTGRRCVVSLPRHDVCVQSVRLPKMPDEELQQAAAWEAAQRFSFDRAAMEITALRTGALLQSGDSREEVLLVAASHAVLHGRLKPILDAGLRPIAVDTGFAAMARVFSRQFRRDGDTQHVRAILDVGRSGSTVMILRGNQIAFCKRIVVGGRKFDEAVAEHLQMDLPAAAELRATRIVHACSKDKDATPANDPSTERAVYDAVRPLIGELVKEVTLCLRYYGVTFRGRPPAQILVAGGDGLEPNLGELLTNACKIPVAFDDDDETLKSLAGELNSALHRTAGPAACWAVAAGLSIWSLMSSKSASRTVATRETRGAAA